MLFLLVILWTRFGLLLCDAVITCDASSAIEGYPAIITCHFHENVSQTKRNILLYQHLNRSGSNDLVTVVNCNWIHDSGCRYDKTGYQLGQFGKRTTIEIEQTSKQMAGKYTCDVARITTDSNIVPKPCYFAVKDNYENPMIHNSLQETKDETGSSNGKVTAILVLCAIIITIITLVILLFFRKQLKDHLQRCCTRCRSPQEGEGDPEGAGMLRHSNDHAGDEGKAKERKKIDRYIRVLKTMKQEGELDEFYKVSHADKKENTKSDLATCSAVRGASASNGKEMLKTSELQEPRECKLLNDPEVLLITIKEWQERELAEINRRKEEIDALTDLYTVRERHKREILRRKEEDRRKGITDPTEDNYRRERREKQELDRKVEESTAVAKLDIVIKRHEEERKKQEKQDRERVENAKNEVLMKEKKGNPSEEKKQATLLTSVPVNDGGADEDIEM